MISNKETLLDDGIENYEKHAYDRIYILEYGLKDLLETIILEINEIPKSEVYIAVRESTGRSILFKKKKDEKVDSPEFFIEASSVFQNNGVLLKNISGILNIKTEELFIQGTYVTTQRDDYQVYLIIHTEYYNKYIGLKYYYERFAFASKSILSLKKCSPVCACGELADNTVRFIYADFMNYNSKKIIPQFSLITKLSAMTYENSKCNAKIICTHEIKKLDNKLVNPVILDAYNLRAVRKLLEIANDEIALIVHWRTVEGEAFPLFEVLGFAKIEQYEYCSQFAILGYLQWKLIDEGKTILNYCKGRYVVRKENEIDDAYLKKCLKDVFGNNANIDSIENIVNNAWGQTHGTTLIITSDAQKEVSRLCDNNRGYQIEELEFDLQYNNLVKNITSVDGAIIIDELGRCFGIGIILDGKCIVKGNPSRGARFNSAYNYIAIMQETNKNAIAVVISEDRTIDIITSREEFAFGEIK